LNEYQRIEKYTKQRMRELKGEVRSIEPMDPYIEKYTRNRIRELQLEREIRESQINVDNVLFRGYTMATMEVYRGDD
tara:strand:+ start:275 stop:505 length:231 start_codon:yes stop_codon:yes gene_type:complete